MLRPIYQLLIFIAHSSHFIVIYIKIRWLVLEQDWWEEIYISSHSSFCGYNIKLSWCNVVLSNILCICLHISLFCIIYPLTFYLFLLPAVPKQEDEGTHVPSHVQENVFIEGSRPKYLEDLHTEALEGLKLQQQEGTKHPVNPSKYWRLLHHLPLITLTN